MPQNVAGICSNAQLARLHLKTHVNTNRRKHENSAAKPYAISVRAFADLTRSPHVASLLQTQDQTNTEPLAVTNACLQHGRRHYPSARLAPSVCCRLLLERLSSIVQHGSAKHVGSRP